MISSKSPEIKLIECLQKGFSNNYKKKISYSELGIIFEKKDLMTRTLRDNSSFMKFTIEKMENIVKEQLTGENQRKALDAIDNYKIIKGYKRKKNSSNQAEIELINKLRETFSGGMGELISVSALSKMILSEDAIPLALRKESTFKKFTTDKMEDAVMARLTGKNQELALNAITTYREIKGYNSKIRARNQAEIDLIESLQEIFSSEFQQPISISALSDLIASARFIGRRLVSKGKFSRYSIDKMKIAVEDYLTNKNQEKAFDSIDEYCIIKGYKSEGVASNQPEIDLIEILQNSFSTQEGRFISYSKLSRMIGSENLIARNLKQKFSFRKDTIDKLEELTYNKLNEENLEAALSAINDYIGLRRYKVVHPISQHPDPIVSNNYLDKLKNFHKLSNFLRNITNIGPPKNVFKNYDKQPRISKFRIKGISSKDREIFIRKLKSSGLIKEFFYKSRNKENINSVKDEEINQILYNLMLYVQPKFYKNENLSKYSSLPTHEAITLKIAKTYENCIGIEIPIWKPIGLEFFLTGHPDLVLICDEILLIADYKPSQLTSKGTLKRKFFHSLPQICSYGILFKKNFEIKNIMCITFNHIKSWIYEPESLLKKLNKIISKYDKNLKIPWNHYLTY